MRRKTTPFVCVKCGQKQATASRAYCETCLPRPTRPSPTYAGPHPEPKPRLPDPFAPLPAPWRPHLGPRTRLAVAGLSTIGLLAGVLSTFTTATYLEALAALVGVLVCLAQQLIANLPPLPTRVRVTTATHKALRATLKATTPTPSEPLLGLRYASLIGLPLVVDDELPAAPGWAIDYS